MIHLEPLGPQHAASILHGQDQLLVDEVFGTRWDPESLQEFLARVSRWRPDGPLREYAAMDDGELVGGGGLHLVGTGLKRGQAALTYWVLPAHRRHGLGASIASALVDLARAEPRIEELVLRIAPHNTASAAVARRLGAEPVGRTRAGGTERHPADASRLVERWTLPLDRPAPH